MEKAAEVCIISKHTIRPPHNNNNSEVEVMNSRRRRRRRIHLTPWDLRMISMDYIQKGILFSKPPPSHPYYHQLPLVVDRLMTSFSHAVTHFYPLAGRLSTTYHHDDDDHTLSISLVCNNEGAEFVHASAPRVTVSDILTAQYIPRVVHSFFPLRQLINHDGHSHPLIGVQVTELADGIFIGCSLNHSVADGTSFWHFFNTWSTICRTGNNNAIEHPPLLDRWFPNPASCPVRLPFANHRQFIRRVNPPPVRECAFNFSPQSIKNLKTKANKEISDNNNNNVISSLQALLAHTWRAVTRARGLAPDQKTTYVVYVGYRSRLTPPLTQSYLGNATSGAPATELAGEMANKGLGWTAQLLNQAVAAKGEKEIRDWVESWIESPSLVYLDGFKEVDLVTGSSPRFDVYGNDFGWGRPVAVRSGRGSKMDGKVTVYPGPEEGSMMLEVCLNEDALAVLVKDEEFMEVVG